MKRVVGAILIVSCTLFAMQPNKQEAGSGSENESIKFIVDKESIASLRKQGFNIFIEAKRGQHSKLSTITSLPFGLGRVASSALEGLGVVEDTDHAKCFLGRIFEEDEDAFRATANCLEEQDHNIEYLQAIFEQLNSKRVSKDELVQAMRAARHKLVPEPSQMGEKNDDDEYTLSHEHFCPWAACNLLIFHWHEQQEKEQRTPRRLKKRGSGAQKRS